MSTVFAAESPPREYASLPDATIGLTLSDLFDRFGSMPAWRVLFDPEPGTATEEDLIELIDGPKVLCELIDGVLVRKTMGTYESLLAAYLIARISNWNEAARSGWVLAGDGPLRLWPGRVRVPDVCFISKSQTPDGRFPRGERVSSLHPDLAIEVLSDSNTRKEMEQKLRDYFQAGTQLVWYVDPMDETVTVYTEPTNGRVLHKGESLVGDPVLTGFSLALADLFQPR